MKDKIVLLLKVNGPTFVVQYLKECTRITCKFIAGTPCTISEGVSVSLINGLPRLIPGALRKLIRQGDKVTIRAVLTLLSLYKVLKARPKLKINTITDPFNGFSKTINPLLVEKAVALLPRSDKGWCRPLVSVSAGPNHKKAFMSLPYDAIALSGKPRILLALSDLADNFGGAVIYDALKKEISILSKLFSDEQSYKLAKLSFLKEPAGKVRVVAILDG